MILPFKNVLQHILQVHMWKEDSLIVTTVHPNEIVPRRGPPSVDYEESDEKVNQS